MNEENPNREHVPNIQDKVDETSRRVYIAQFFNLATSFLINKYVEQHGPEEIESVIETWRNSVGEIIGEEIKNSKGLGGVLNSAGLISQAEIHERADRLMFESEEAIRDIIGLPKS